MFVVKNYFLSYTIDNTIQHNTMRGAYKFMVKVELKVILDVLSFVKSNDLRYIINKTVSLKGHFLSHN